MTRGRSEPTHFLNVDLEIAGRVSQIGVLVKALNERLISLHELVERGRVRAHFESLSPRSSRTPALTLRTLLDVIEALPVAARHAWKLARVRDFNIGIQAGRLPHFEEYAVESETLTRVARLGGRVVVTVYAPFPRPRSR